MMSDHFTTKWVQDFSKRFGLGLSDEKIEELRTLLKGHKFNYDGLKLGNTGRATFVEDRKALKSAALAAKRANKAFKDALDRFECKIRAHEANVSLHKIFLPNSGSTDFDGIASMLRALSETLDLAAEKDFDPPSKPNTIAIEIMVINFKDLWDEYFSSIEFTEGHHYSGIGHNSDALDLLETILVAYDDSIERTQVASALRKVRESVKK